MATIYDKTAPGPSEKVLILGVREVYTQPFEAPGWTDLRVGWFLSVCEATGDDTITGLAETITNPSHLPRSSYYSIGLTDKATGNTFYGYTNVSTYLNSNSIGDSILASSDIGIGTSDTDYWRPTNSLPKEGPVQLLDSGHGRERSEAGSEPHFVQDFSGGHADGYATLLMLRLTRPNATSSSKIITMSVKTSDPSGDSSDVLFTSDPSREVLETNLETFPETVQTLGPITMSQAPDSFYFYWPFSGSRLRVHAYGLMKFL